MFPPPKYRRFPVLAWINQPSTLQPLHQYHGRLVYAKHDPPDMAHIFFLDTKTSSMRVSWLWLSEGWPKHLRKLN